MVVRPHRGTIRIDATSLPADPAKMPGLVRSWNASGARCWRFVVEGWSLQLNAKKNGTGTLLVTAPERPTTDLETALDDEGQKAAAQKFAIAWALPHGLGLVRAREAPTQVQPREYAIPLPGVDLEPTGNPAVDQVFIDGSHPDSIEVQGGQSKEIVRFVAGGPEFERTIHAIIRESREALARTKRLLAELVQEGRSAAEVAQLLVQVQAQHGRAVATLLAPPVTPAAPAVGSSFPASNDRTGYA